MLAQLIAVDSGETITLTEDVTVVGRSEELCDLAIDAKSISKLQAVLVKTDGLVYLRDLCSTNGTRVNGQRVTRGALLPGDELAFAKVRYTVHLGPDPQPNAALTNDGQTAPTDEYDSGFNGTFGSLDEFSLDDDDPS